jgi:hypothetical protein
MSLTHEIHVLAWHGSRRQAAKIAERFEGLDIEALDSPDQSPRRIAHTTNPLLASALRATLEKAGAEIVVIEKEPAPPWLSFWRRRSDEVAGPELSLAAATAAQEAEAPDSDEPDESEDDAETEEAPPSRPFNSDRRRFESAQFMALGVCVIVVLLAAGWFGMSLLPHAGSPDFAASSANAESMDGTSAIANLEGTGGNGALATLAEGSGGEIWPLEPPGLSEMAARDADTILLRWALLIVGSLIVIVGSQLLLRNSPVWMRLVQATLCSLLFAISGVDTWLAQAAAHAQRTGFAVEFTQVQQARHETLRERQQAAAHGPADDAEGSGNAAGPSGAPPPAPPPPASDPGAEAGSSETGAAGDSSGSAAQSGSGEGSSSGPVPPVDRASAGTDRPAEREASGAPAESPDPAAPEPQTEEEGSSPGLDPESAIGSGADDSESSEDFEPQAPDEGSAERRSVVDMVRGLQSAPERPCDFPEERAFERLHCLIEARERLRPSDELIAASGESNLRVGAALSIARRRQRESAAIELELRTEQWIEEISAAMPLPEEPDAPVPVSPTMWLCGVVAAALTAAAVLLARRLSGTVSGGQL